jgi:hypothetical protein
MYKGLYIIVDLRRLVCKAASSNSKRKSSTVPMESLYKCYSRGAALRLMRCVHDSKVLCWTLEEP